MLYIKMKLGYQMSEDIEQDGFVRLNTLSDILAFKHAIKYKRSRYLIFEVKPQANRTQCVHMKLIL